MIKVILFDLGGVLFTNGTKKFIGYLHTKYGTDKDLLKNIVDKGEIPDAYREGKIGRDEFWKAVQEKLQLPESTESLEKEWIYGYELIEETKNIIQELTKSYKVYFLSDNVKERVDAINKKFNFLMWFEGGVFSHEVGIRKPNPKIYQFALEKAGVKPQETVFIDDKESALLPAKDMGITTLLFESPTQLRNDLKKIGLNLQ